MMIEHKQEAFFNRILKGPVEDKNTVIVEVDIYVDDLKLERRTAWFNKQSMKQLKEYESGDPMLFYYAKEYKPTRYSTPEFHSCRFFPKIP